MSKLECLPVLCLTVALCHGAHAQGIYNPISESYCLESNMGGCFDSLYSTSGKSQVEIIGLCEDSTSIQASDYAEAVNCSTPLQIAASGYSNNNMTTDDQGNLDTIGEVRAEGEVVDRTIGTLLSTFMAEDCTGAISESDPDEIFEGPC